ARATGATALVEKDLTLAFAKKIEATVTAKTGARVLLSRSADVHLSTVERPSFANEARADLFLSLHLNASPSPEAKGFRVYYHDPSGAEMIAPALEAAPAIPWSAAQRDVEGRSAHFADLLRESLAAKVTLADRGVKRVPLAVLEGATCPAALVELGFLSNHDEALALSTDAVQDAVAEAVADAIVKMDASLAEAEGTR
ncbi:MAG TPA: N-acetylmuramoyl-L-alanine amidase, partial [bacterium]|nr:N-acetylmuramoyl-L-alanine amidase [bacterium]